MFQNVSNILVQIIKLKNTPTIDDYLLVFIIFINQKFNGLPFFLKLSTSGKIPRIISSLSDIDTQEMLLFRFLVEKQSIVQTFE